MLSTMTKWCPIVLVIGVRQARHPTSMTLSAAPMLTTTANWILVPRRTTG
jgi:hypothetical protein